ncbi:hypothetical protein KFK09_003708 [Dendrobium nobile]|uniref:DUF4283 domain-containing protein n=1 Tax=Dendrobium nobile TaxID=94219 RepID=A0A8T3C3Y0_DENNO|nr:hypothetical protein KFK09_003708 [Dendrobium nobile]
MADAPVVNPWGKVADKAVVSKKGFFNLDAEGSVSPSKSRSFKDVLAGASSSGDTFPNVKQDVFNGVPAVLLSDDEVLKLASPFQYTLVGKFGLRRPNLDAIRNFFLSLKLSGFYSVGLLDARHVAIQLSNDLDYSRVFARRSYFILNYQMRVLKWTPFFDIKEESPIVPIWISFPNLRLHFFNSKVLHALGSIFGRPLQTDQATASKTRPSVARVLVEVDISRNHPKEVWVGSKAYGYMQKAEFEKVPEFCNHCKIHGHAVFDCFKLNPELKKPAVHPNRGHGSAENNKVYVPVTKKIAEADVIPVEPISAVHNISLNDGETIVVEENVVGKEISQEKVDEPIKSGDNDTMMNKGNNIMPDPKLFILVNDLLNELPVKSNSVTMENALLSKQDINNLEDECSDTYEEGEVIPMFKVVSSPINNQGNISSSSKLKANKVVDEDVVSKGGKKKGKQGKNYCPATPRSTRAQNSSKEVVHCQVMVGDVSCFASFVYAACTRLNRLNLWEKLVNFANNINGPWCVGGDFNIIANANERRGGKCPNYKAMEDLNEMITNCNLNDIGFCGSPFTWNRANLFQRLDRILFNNEWLARFSGTNVEHLSRTLSDHVPLLLNINVLNHIGNYAFRFLNMWLLHDNFKEVLQNNWNAPVFPDNNISGMLRLWAKLARLKQCLRYWNKHIFKNIFSNILDMEAKAIEWEGIFLDNPSEVNNAKLSAIKNDLVNLKKQEEAFWHQKANTKFIIEGDRNTKFFHAIANKNKTKSKIHKIINNDNITLDSDELICKSGVDYFMNLFKCNEGILPLPNPEYIPRYIETEENIMLCQLPLETEIFNVLREMNGDATAGPDGFTTKFFQKSWDIVKDDVILAVQDFFKGIRTEEFTRGIRYGFCFLFCFLCYFLSNFAGELS